MINKGKFVFKANRYKDYFVGFDYQGKQLLGILGYSSEMEICIVKKGMQISQTTEEITGFIKKRGDDEKFEFQGKPTMIENRGHKGRNYTFIWLHFNPPINLSETLIALEMASFSDL
jgi:hypothetical protein